MLLAPINYYLAERLRKTRQNSAFWGFSRIGLSGHRSLGISAALLLLILFSSTASNASLSVRDADGAVHIDYGENALDQSKLTEVRDRLDANNINYKTEARDTKLSLGFIVVSERFDNREAASDILSRLFDRGERDFLFVNRGVYLNRISAGVFQSMDAAASRMRGLKDKGFSFKVIERFSTRTQSQIVITDSTYSINDITRLVNGESARTMPNVSIDISRDSNERIPAIAYPVSPSRLLPDRVAPDRVAPDRVAPDQKGTASDTNTAAIGVNSETRDSIPETSINEKITEPSVAPKTNGEDVTEQNPGSGEKNSAPSAIGVSATDTGGEVDGVEPALSPKQETVKRSNPMKVSLPNGTTEQTRANWLWFLFAGVFIIIAGAISFYYLQQRKERVAPDPVASDRNEPTSEQEKVAPSDALLNQATSPEAMIHEYAKAVLGGKSELNSDTQLTIFGSDDNTLTELIQDLLFIKRLDEHHEAVDPITFEVRSLTDNMISQLAHASSKAGVTLKSEPDEDLPATVALDAGKLSRLLRIIVQYAVSRTESGLISVAQSFDAGQLVTEIKFHPALHHFSDELMVLTNPAKENANLTIGERVRFGVANRLTLALSGRIDTDSEQGEALIKVRVPAIVVQPTQLLLPSGRTIDDLIAAEEAAVDEAKRTKQAAQASIEALTSRAANIEESAESSIHALRTELSDIETETALAQENLKSSEEAIQALKHQLTQTETERERLVSKSHEEKAAAATELNRLNLALESAQQALEQESQHRNVLEQQASLQVRELENQLRESSGTASQQQSELREKEAATQQIVSALKAQLSDLTTSHATETDATISALQRQLEDAENELTQESASREASNTSAQSNLDQLQLSLAVANDAAKLAQAGKSQAEQKYLAAIGSLESSKQVVESRIVELEKESEKFRANSERLETALVDANLELAQEKQEREKTEHNATDRIRQMEQEVIDATSVRDADVATRESLIGEANTEITALKADLLEASNKNSHAELDHEVEAMQLRLKAAEAHLEAEVARRNKAEAAAGIQIEELLDELNLLRMSSNTAKKETDRAHADKVDAIESMKQELEQALKLEKVVKAEKEQLALQAREEVEALTQKLNLMQEDHVTLIAKVDRADAYGNHQTALLEEALADAQSATKLGDAARKVTQHLKAKIKRLEAELADTNHPENNPVEAERPKQPLDNDAEPISANPPDETVKALLEEPLLVDAANDPEDLEEPEYLGVLEKVASAAVVETTPDVLTDLNTGAQDTDPYDVDVVIDGDADFSLDGFDENEDVLDNPVEAFATDTDEYTLAEDTENPISQAIKKGSDDNETKLDLDSLTVVDIDQLEPKAESEIAGMQLSLEAAPELGSELPGSNDEASVENLLVDTPEDDGGDPLDLSFESSEKVKSSPDDRAVFQIDEPAEIQEEMQDVGQEAPPERVIKATHEGRAIFKVDGKIPVGQSPADTPPPARIEVEPATSLGMENNTEDSGISFDSIADPLPPLPAPPEPEIEFNIEPETQNEPEFKSEPNSEAATLTEPKLKPAPKSKRRRSSSPTPAEVPVLFVESGLGETGGIEVEPSAGKEPSAEQEPSADGASSSANAPSKDEEPSFEFQFDDKPIRSSRPVKNPVLHSMIERFVDRLFEHIDAMENALAKRDYLELVVSCNWVRGESNTLGFETLTTPISSIELQLRREKFSQIITHLSELRNMAERIEIKHIDRTDAPIEYVVPSHAKNAIIYENFVSQLGSKLLELEVASNANNTRQMTQVCRWINRYGTKIKFVEVVDAAEQLQIAIDTSDTTLISENLESFISLYAKIEIVKNKPTTD